MYTTIYTERWSRMFTLVVLAAVISTTWAFSVPCTVRSHRWSQQQQLLHASPSDSSTLFETRNEEKNLSTLGITTTRRAFGRSCSMAAAAATLVMPVASKAVAAEPTEPNSEYTRQTDQFAYAIQPPKNFGPGNQKPLRTHLDEINFNSNTVAGYQFGVTVDPVRIESLRQFGTPEQVAAKVVLAEVNRDGVFDVTLMEDPVAGPNDAYYQLNYQSKGKRGNKRFVAKFYIHKQKLYALTAQCKEDDYPNLKAEMLKAVESFRVL